MISIVIPAKNEENNIAGVLDALFLAIGNFPGKCEVILVDNGSIDCTRTIADNFGCRVIEAPIVTTIAAMRNLGVKLSLGNIIAFLDADCLVDINWINFCLERLLDSKVGLVGTRCIPDMNNATWVEEGWYKLFTGIERPDFPRWIGSSNMFVKKKVFEEVGGFSETLITSEDVDICNKISKNHLIQLERRIFTIHLRESKTLKQLVKREIWRGSYSIRQTNNFFELISDKSLQIALVFICSAVALLISGIFYAKFTIYIFLLILTVPLVMIVAKKANISNLYDFAEVYIVAFFYIFSRSVSLICEILSICNNDFSSKFNSNIR